MKSNVRARFQDLIYTVRQRNPDRCLILVLDSISVRILSSFLKLKDLFDLGVAAIEKLELKRKPYPKYDAFYFLHPREESIQFLLQDYAQDHTYRKANLIFTSKLEKKFLDQISKSPLANRIIQIKSFNHQIYFLEENTFHLDLSPILFTQYDQVVHLLATAFPSMRPFECLKLTCGNQAFASLFTASIAPMLKQWQLSNQLPQEGGLLHVLVLDRSFDLLTPLLHDFHLESLIVDLLQGADFNPFECDDEVYQKYRYKHIAYGLEGIPAEFQQMVSTNPTAQLHKGDMKDLDAEKMRLIMATMPNYNTQLKYYTYHMNQIDQIWKQFEAKGLKELGEVEQALATGTTKQGHQTKSEQLYQEVLLLLQSKIIGDQDKLRLVLVALLTLQMPEYDRKNLIDKISDWKPLGGLKMMGLDTSKLTSSRITKNINTDTRLLAKQKLSQMTLELQRHTAGIERVVVELLGDGTKMPTIDVYGELKEQPYVAPSLRQKKQEVKNQLNLLVFVIGGISHAEIASLRNLSFESVRNLYIGSTSILSPNQYLEQLRIVAK